MNYELLRVGMDCPHALQNFAYHKHYWNKRIILMMSDIILESRRGEQGQMTMGIWHVCSIYRRRS